VIEEKTMNLLQKRIDSGWENYGSTGNVEEQFCEIGRVWRAFVSGGLWGELKHTAPV
jgi:hypothetical protein